MFVIIGVNAQEDIRDIRKCTNDEVKSGWSVVM